MIRKIDHNNMGRSQLGWLNSWFHFSFAEYYNPGNMHFGSLRVVNDDLIAPHSGFDTHPHENMEIITYVVNGQLTHGDSMNHQRTLHRGEVQYMSAGTGVFHSEMNQGEEELRLLQIWIFPDKDNYPPQYGDYLFPWEDRKNRWLHIVSGENGDAPIKIHQDMNIYASQILDERTLRFEFGHDRQGYFIVIEGDAAVNGQFIGTRDAAEIQREVSIEVTASPNAHVILFDMPAE